MESFVWTVGDAVKVEVLNSKEIQSSKYDSLFEFSVCFDFRIHDFVFYPLISDLDKGRCPPLAFLPNLSYRVS